MQRRNGRVSPVTVEHVIWTDGKLALGTIVRGD